MIPGLTYIENFITHFEHGTLLHLIMEQPWSDALKRKVQQYGYKYDYTKKNIDDSLKLGPLPYWLNNYANKLVNDKYFEVAPDQVIINQYTSGQGITKHLDCVPCFGDTIASLSLLAPCPMDFEHTKTNEIRTIVLQPRSLVVLTGEARYKWMHSIKSQTVWYESDNPVGGRRISLTFRNVIK